MRQIMAYWWVPTVVATLVAFGTVPARQAAMASEQSSNPPSAEAAGEPAEARAEPPADQRRVVELAICLDTSGSMRGLIDSAKQKLWAVVNEFATARPRPVLRVALYHYGNTGLDAETGWVQQLSPLTTNLDDVYGKLFALTTNGGTEYVSRATRAATRELDWTERDGALKIIVVAGNEPATQDPDFPLQKTCKAAISNGIIVNTIFCGADATGRQSGWLDAARWADGQYASIDQDEGTVAIETPYDDKLTQLSAELNDTYVAYGRQGGTKAANQAAQDTNASGMGAPAGAVRAEAKASGVYRNAEWDLVDAVSEGEIEEMEDVDRTHLPEKLRKMSDEELAAYVKQQQQRRSRIQKQIRQLSEKRDDHVQAEMKKRNLSDDKAFDTVLRRTVRNQAEAAGFEFEGGSEQPQTEPEATD